MKSHNSCGLCKIEIKNLSVKNKDEIILDDISLILNCGELTGLIGKNGAGKTTLIKSLLGEKKYNGEIYFKSYDDKNIKKPIIGYVPQQLEFDKNTPITVMDFIISSISKFPVWLKYKKKEEERVLENLKNLDCIHLAYKKLGDLSGGELQRILLALALMPLPDILILDEPVSGVDILGLDTFYKTVDKLRKNYHIAILLVSHDLNLIEKYADKIILLNKQIKLFGNAKEIFKSDEFKEIFGVNIT